MTTCSKLLSSTRNRPQAREFMSAPAARFEPIVVMAFATSLANGSTSASANAARRSVSSCEDSSSFPAAKTSVPLDTENCQSLVCRSAGSLSQGLLVGGLQGGRGDQQGVGQCFGGLLGVAGLGEGAQELRVGFDAALGQQAGGGVGAAGAVVDVGERFRRAALPRRRPRRPCCPGRPAPPGTAERRSSTHAGPPAAQAAGATDTAKVPSPTPPCHPLPPRPPPAGAASATTLRACRSPSAPEAADSSRCPDPRAPLGLSAAALAADARAAASAAAFAAAAGGSRCCAAKRRRQCGCGSLRRGAVLVGRSSGLRQCGSPHCRRRCRRSTAVRTARVHWETARSPACPYSTH